jgi:hypothetical protein
VKNWFPAFTPIRKVNVNRSLPLTKANPSTRITRPAVAVTKLAIRPKWPQWNNLPSSYYICLMINQQFGLSWKKSPWLNVVQPMIHLTRFNVIQRALMRMIAQIINSNTYFLLQIV